MKDIREFIEKCREMGELKTFEGASWDLEIGGITFEVASLPNPPALLFDKVEGCKPGFRVLTIPCTTDKRLALTLRLPVESTRLELVRGLRDKLNEPLKLIPPVEVKDAPIMENVYQGDDVDLYQFPSLRWTTRDGGRYIGMGDNTIVRDPEEGWVNVSTNRIQVHDKDTITIFCEHGQHLDIIRQKYWKKGKSCPVAITFGGDPLLVNISSNRIPWGVSEYDYAGFWMKEPLQIVKGPDTGLPIPAHSEIAVEGEILPLDKISMMEGPFTEFTGHYSPEGPEAVCKVSRVMHRDDPILMALITYLGPGVPTWTRGPMISAQIWDELDKIVTGVRGVWALDEFGLERCLVISLQQQYPGHAKQAALLAQGFYPHARKYVVVVDEDIDPSNLREVLFALGNRADPETFELIKGNWTSKLDPLVANPEKKRLNDITIPAMVILACKPYSWIESFPPPVVISPDMKKLVREKWGDLIN